MNFETVPTLKDFLDKIEPGIFLLEPSAEEVKVLTYILDVGTPGGFAPDFERSGRTVDTIIVIPPPGPDSIKMRIQLIEKSYTSMRHGVVKFDERWICCIYRETGSTPREDPKDITTPLDFYHMLRKAWGSMNEVVVLNSASNAIRQFIS